MPWLRLLLWHTWWKIMLVCKAVEFKSSMEPNNIREFYMAFVTWCKTRHIYKMFLYLRARTLTTICPCLDAVVNDCWCLYPSSPRRQMTNPFATLIQVKLTCFKLPSRCHIVRIGCAQNALICIQNFIFPNTGHSFFAVKNVNKTFISKKIGNVL